jgi:adenylate cyclase
MSVDPEVFTVTEAARRAGVTPATLRRWVAVGVVPAMDGGWTSNAVAHARIVARLRERGHSLEEIREATESGRLAFGYIEDLLPGSGPAGEGITAEEAADETGLEPALIERIFSALGFNTQSLDHMTEDDVQMLRYVAAVLAAGLPLVAFLQLCRVYGQALAQMADAEVRLFHLYVHEPLMREGVPGVEMAGEMQDLARQLLPLASPMMDHLHQRFLAHFVEQDVVGHMESDLGGEDLALGRLRVGIAFADLAGYTRLTEEEGEEEAVGAVERFVEAVEHTLPDDARVIKTIGDEVMIVGADGAALVDWAVGFQQLMDERPLPRIGIHYGETLYPDGDYYGREVNLAARVAARSAGGEVIVTRPLVELAGPHLEFARIGEVRLKGFTEPTELFVASPAED